MFSPEKITNQCTFDDNSFKYFASASDVPIHYKYSIPTKPILLNIRNVQSPLMYEDSKIFQNFRDFKFNK